MAKNYERCTFPLNADLEGLDRVVLHDSGVDELDMTDEDPCDECGVCKGEEHDEDCSYANGYNLMEAEYKLYSSNPRQKKVFTY